MSRNNCTPEKRALAGAVLLGFAYGFAIYLALFIVTFALVISIHLDIEIAAFVLATAAWVLPPSCILWQVQRELRAHRRAHPAELEPQDGQQD